MRIKIKTINEYAAEDLANALREANGSDVFLDVNSSGGLVMSGFDMFSEIINYSGKVHAHISGVAASSASWIALAADTISIVDYGLIMWHMPFDTSDKELDDNTIKMIEKFADSIITIYSKRLGWTEDKIRGLMDNETWFSAEDADKMGIVDEVIPTDEKIRNMVSEILNNTNNKPEQVANIIETQIINNSKSNMKDLANRIANLLDTTEDRAFERVQNLFQANKDFKAELKGKEVEVENLNSKIEELENSMSEYEKERKERLKAEGVKIVNKAIKDLKITKASKDEWLEMYNESPERTSNILENLPKNQSISDGIENQGGNHDEPEIENDAEGSVQGYMRAVRDRSKK